MFFERAQKITDLPKGELKDASVTEKMQTAEKTKESTPLQPLVDIVPENFFFSFKYKFGSLVELSCC